MGFNEEGVLDTTDNTFVYKQNNCTENTFKLNISRVCFKVVVVTTCVTRNVLTKTILREQNAAQR